MILQNDPRLNPEIQKYGCRFRCLLAIGEVHTGKQLTALAIEQAYRDSVPGAMNVHCKCNENEAKISRWSLRTLGSSARCYQIGLVYGCARMEFWPAAQVYTIRKGLVHRQGEPGYETAPGFHFRLGDRTGRIIFDPLPGVTIIEEHEVLVYQLIS